MIPEFTTTGYVKGLQTKLPAEDIEKPAGSEGLNWASLDGTIELMRGRRLVGEDGGRGAVYNSIWAPKVNGEQVHFVKRDTDIGYYDDDEVYHPVITGLTAGAVYTFSVYSSLAGNYLFATGIDGLYKIALANPDSYKNMYYRDFTDLGFFNDPDSPNYLGHSIIQDRRMFLWNRFDDVQNKTTLFASKIDPMDGTNYSVVNSELLDTSTGTPDASGTLAQPANANIRAFAFGLEVYSDEDGLFTANISEMNAIGSGYVQIYIDDTSGFTEGDYVRINDDLGEPDPTNSATLIVTNAIKGSIVKVANVDDDHITVFLPDYGDATVDIEYGEGTVTRLRCTPVEDNNNGGWQNDVEGSINYATGVTSVTLPYTPPSGVPVYVYYLWEDSNNDGLTDFGTDDLEDNTQGISISQEYGGEAIQNVLVFEGGFYSLKKTSVYELIPTTDWSSYTNEVYRVSTGIPSLFGCVSTAQGIVYMDTANPSDPILTILQRSTVGGNLSPLNMTPLFDWSVYEFDQCVIDTWGPYIVVSCRTPDSETNNRTMLVNVRQEYAVDVSYYGSNCFSKKDGLLYGGSPTKDSVYELFSGFDDLGTALENEWKGKAENYGDDSLKKTRYMQFRGLIDPLQRVNVYAEFDNGAKELLGTIDGQASYVDVSNPAQIGANMLGSQGIGGGTGATVYPFLMQIKVRTPKFRVRRLVYVALGKGYVGIEMSKDFDILGFEQRLPSKNRVRSTQSYA